MRHVFRCVMVLTISLALVATAAAWRQCAGLQTLAAVAAGGNDDHAAVHRADASHGEHDHHAMMPQGAADESAPATDHGCMKCCSMCTVATAVLASANADVIFIVTTHLFSRDQRVRSGNKVAVDPGIPKHIV